ncbi:UUP1 family membrane protein [Vibrio gallaecicus]|uniref:UUP1 family membrane protein n=1 Tax=Vibrio gallaecicus TaxID=552386 RepID=UPI00338E1466
MSIRHAEGPQTIYYKTQFLVDDQAKITDIPPEGEITPPSFNGPEEAAALALIDRATHRSADNFTFTRELIKH